MAFFKASKIFKPSHQAISDAWVSGQAYAVGDYCIYGEMIYRCIQTVTQGTVILPTNTSYWTPTNIASEIESLNSRLDNVIDESAFLGNDFTAPDFSYYERVTRVSGGYKKVGNMVYVQVSLKPKSSGYSFFTSGGGGGLACKLPRKHPDYQRSIMFSVVVNKAIFGCCVYLYNDSSDERKGILNYVGPQVSAIDDTCNLTICGAYITNE